MARNSLDPLTARFRSSSFGFPQTDSTISLPKTFEKLNELLKTSDHKAANLIGTSLKAYRSPYEAIVFLYGITGEGKSSTLNHLFNTTLIPTSEDRSCTRGITEYVATMDSDHWHVTDLEIGFVDTPGFGDTCSNEQEIENLAKIDAFLSSHPFLNSRIAPHQFYPNIVMIVSSINNTRMAEFNSQFSKMLRMLTKFDIVDKVRLNVVVVLTSAMSIRPMSKYVENKKKKLGLVDNLVRLYFGVRVPIVIIENVNEDLEPSGDWTLLPDRTLQPLNLFDAMISLMKESGDEIGVETVRILFQNRKNIQIYDEREYGSDKGIFKGIKWQPNIPKWKDIYLSEFNLKFDSSKVNRMIIACIEKKQFPELSSLSYVTISPFMYRLLQVNLTDPSELSCKNIEEISQLLYPFCMNIQERILLFVLFKVKPLGHLDFDILGSGVLAFENILKFHIIPSKELKYCYEIGTHVPEISTFTSKGRLHIHCRCEWVKENIFSTRKAVVSFAVQYELFNLTINFKQLTFEQMENSFIKAVSYLPNDVFDHSNKKITDAYKFFIDKYGTQCVMGVSYGGEINGSINIPLGEPVGKEYLLKLNLDMKKLLWLYFETLQNPNLSDIDYSHHMDASSKRLFQILLHSPINWGGGDKHHHTSKLANLNTTNLKKWVGSLSSNFILLENIVHVCPISALLHKRNAEMAKNFQTALEKLFPNEFDVNDFYFFVYQNPERTVWNISQRLESSTRDIPQLPLSNVETRIAAGDRVKSESTCFIF
ncbi:hypothetical protein LOD99_14044 [Oopsacas minuta]|uniref:Uncharacterized protein n=1 Tax=Oopsacas minuta TaxID=111878 RepID=A0AAV7KIR5_9METZ|nr:hypothetical protein LOD99_14044 [Oopsacas minuta]